MVADVLIIILKGLVAGTLVVVFSVVAQAVKPKTLAGVFGAAPTIAAASLAVTLLSDGATRAAAFAAGMVAGSAAMLGYCITDASLLKRLGSLEASAITLGVWFALAAAGYVVALR